MAAAKCARFTDMFAIATTSSTAAAGAGPEKKREVAIQVDLEKEEEEEEEEEADVTQQGQIEEEVRIATFSLGRSSRTVSRMKGDVSCREGGGPLKKTSLCPLILTQ